MESKKKKIHGLFSAGLRGCRKIIRIIKRISVKFIAAVIFFIGTIVLFIDSIIRFVGLAIDWDWAINHSFVNSSFNLRIVLILLGSIALSIIPIVIFNLKITWQIKALNKEVLWLLQRYIAIDSRGRFYVFLRHIPHVFLYLWVWWWGDIIRMILSKTKSETRSRKAGHTIHKSHYEAFLLDKLEEAENRTGQALMKFRALILYNSQQEDLIDAVAELRDVIEEEFKPIAALSDYLVCPHCRKSEFPLHVPDISRLWKIIEHCDLFYSRIRLLLKLLSPLENPNVTRFRGKINESCNELRVRLLGYYKLIKEELSKTPDSHNTTETEVTTGKVETAPVFLEKLIDFRLEILAMVRVGIESIDLWLLKRRSQVIDIPTENVNGSGEKNAMYLNLAVQTLTCEFLLNKDWPGIIEWYRLLTIKKSYEPGADDYLDLGESYWHYAKELGPGPLGEWATAQVLKYYYLARAENHLRDFIKPF